MKEHFAEQLEHLRRRLILLGAEVEKQIAGAVEAFTSASATKATVVIANDELIDKTEVEIEEEAIHLFALQQPVAVDLRLLVSCLKINNDLERIGDHAVNIAECAERISVHKPLKPFIDIPSMAEVAMGCSRAPSSRKTTSSTRRTSRSSASCSPTWPSRRL
jgi:phosphate transport system protein